MLSPASSGREGKLPLVPAALQESFGVVGCRNGLGPHGATLWVLCRAVFVTGWQGFATMLVFGSELTCVVTFQFGKHDLLRCLICADNPNRLFWEPQNWDFITALYFSVSALGTAGLAAPTIENRHDSPRDYFLAFWIFTGVPVFGICVGKYDRIAIGKLLLKKKTDPQNRHIQVESHSVKDF